ncbi:hypothetical protein A2U01_0099502, partial [Trifolium medium]|nr:hypothetical protein [Trifolium medium]
RPFNGCCRSSGGVQVVVFSVRGSVGDAVGVAFLVVRFEVVVVVVGGGEVVVGSSSSLF